MSSEEVPFPPKGSVTSALVESADEAGWSPTRIAYVAGLSTATIHKIRHGEQQSIKGDSIIALMRALPSFAERLGFKALDRAA